MTSDAPTQPVPAQAVLAGSGLSELTGHSRQGVKRGANQDRWAAVPAQGGALIVVADGMGGTADGAAAATAAVRAVLTSGRHQTLAETMEAADAAVRHAGAGVEPVWDRPGSTLTVARIAGARLDLLHVGDSSCWLLRDGALTRLSEVHTRAAQLDLAADDPAAAGLDNLLTSYLGMPGGAAVQRSQTSLRPGDRLLVCSDGVTKALRPDALRNALAAGAGPVELVDAAVAAGSRDDVTAVLAVLMA